MDHMTYYPSNRRYEREKLLKVTVAFNRSTEPDLVERMEEQDSKAGYLKRLVRDDIGRGGGAPEKEG